MKHLRQYIRQILLTEGMKTVEELPASITVNCRRDRNANGWWIEFNDPSFDATVWGSMLIGGIPKGKYGNCDNAMRVMSVRTPHGWGPLLYDIAIEWATLKSTGLIPDRMAVSRDANNVWDYYMNNRPDVKKTQLDNLEDSFKNGPQDDCEQLVGDIFNEDIPWQDSSMSKKYSKSPTTIDRLKKLGKWRLEK